MNSSYNNKINFGDIISTITFLQKPTKIVECGILEGYSLDKFIKNSNIHTEILLMIFLINLMEIMQ